MSINLEETALLEYLKTKGILYYGKALELRDAVTDWLSYIPQTFPHYTRHTIHHSNEIVLQLSKLLFKNEEPSQPVIQLSSVEAYILVASALLHDSGMVASDREKMDILRSEDWKKWISLGGGSKRWNEIEELRKGNVPQDPIVRDFLADVQTRFLMAEFIRRTHHHRAGTVVDQHQSLLGRFAFDDPVLQRTIADVCIAHGLRIHELEDKGKYPSRRDIRGQAVNVRLMAILLRLGDLLDLSYDRACPLLLNAACPLPADSFAHWTQYTRISHRLTASDRVEITAECETQEEHRLLQDWCQWLVSEAANARVVMYRAERHSHWQVPLIDMESPVSTIHIQPSTSANYIPSKWAFELDADAVFKRLVYDVYDEPITFVRELIQNALDATRCQMYVDLSNEGTQPPESPTQVDEAWRARYPIRVSLQIREIENPLSGEVETRQVLIIEDSGLGMDREIIQRYFLQVGRSYYRTDEFQRTFRFIPTSRFGIGFLSVFAVSDHVVVNTFKPSSPNHDGPLCLTLTGPKNYLLTEKGQRSRAGTQIEVRLRESMNQGELFRAVSGWCRRVEFPVLVDDVGLERKIIAETASDFTYEIRSAVDSKVRLAVKAFPVNRPGIEGELYVFAQFDGRGESWTEWNLHSNIYPRKNPRAVRPEFPEALVCVYGIAESDYFNDRLIGRIDYRKEVSDLTISRASSRENHQFGLKDPAVVDRWGEILSEHLVTSQLATGKDSWLYKQTLTSAFPVESFWISAPGTIPIYSKGKTKLVSLAAIDDVDSISIVMPAGSNSHKQIRPSIRSIGSLRNPVMRVEEVERFSDLARKYIFRERVLTDVRRHGKKLIVLDWKRNADSNEDDLFLSSEPYRRARIWPIALPFDDTVGFAVHSIESDFDTNVLFNCKHPTYQWLLALRSASVNQEHDIQEHHFVTARNLLVDAIEYKFGLHLEALNSYIAGWREMPNLPNHLQPPRLEITREMLTTPPS